MDNEPVIQGNTTLIDPNNMPQEMWRALLRRLNRKSQSLSKIFKGQYNITIEDLDHLISSIRQQLSNSPTLNATCNGALLLSNNTKSDLTSWDELRQLDHKSPHRTRSISFDLTIDTVNRDTENPERFRVQVSIQNNPAEFGILAGPLAISRIDSFGLPPAPIAVQVEFSDVVIGKNIMGAIEEWEKTLPKLDRKLLRRVQRFSHYFSSLFASVAALSGAYLALSIVSFSDNSSAENLDVLGWQLFVFSVCLLTFYKSGELLGSLFEKLIDGIGASINFVHTKGDQLEISRIKADDTKRYLKLAGAFFAFVVQLLVGLYSADIRSIL